MDKDLQAAQLDEEIKELESLAFGTTDEVKDDEESAETTNSEGTKPTTEDTATETEATVAKPPVDDKADSRNWEAEYKTLRTSTDQYKYVTRQELANLKERLIAKDAEITALKSTVRTPEVDPFKDTFSEEDAKVVGEDALSLMKKAATTAAEAKTKGIKEELERERKLRLDADKRSVAEDRSEATKIFLNKLGNILPEYSDVNLDPAFEVFIKSPDPVNGGTRLTHFKNAEASGNVGVVAQYMREFLGTKQTPVDTLAERVNPTGTPVTATTGEVNVTLIPISEVDQFYEDITKGKYKGNKSVERELEAKYDLAFSKGAIDYMR